MEQFVEIIATFGFPMCACIAIYMDSRKDKERLFDTIDAFGDKLDKFDDTLQGIDRRLADLEEKDVK